MERAAADQKANFPDGIKECGTDALRLTLLQYQQQVSTALESATPTMPESRAVTSSSGMLHKFRSKIAVETSFDKPGGIPNAPQQFIQHLPICALRSAQTALQSLILTGKRQPVKMGFKVDNLCRAGTWTLTSSVWLPIGIGATSSGMPSDLPCWIWGQTFSQARHSLLMSAACPRLANGCSASSA